MNRVFVRLTALLAAILISEEEAVADRAFLLLESDTDGTAFLLLESDTDGTAGLLLESDTG